LELTAFFDWEACLEDPRDLFADNAVFEGLFDDERDVRAELVGIAQIIAPARTQVPNGYT
jgi:hypothetical protein